MVRKFDKKMHYIISDPCYRLFTDYCVDRCSCTYYDGTSCSSRYSPQEMVNRRLDMASMAPSKYFYYGSCTLTGEVWSMTQPWVRVRFWVIFRTTLDRLIWHYNFVNQFQQSWVLSHVLVIPVNSIMLRYDIIFWKYSAIVVEHWVTEVLTLTLIIALKKTKSR